MVSFEELSIRNHRITELSNVLRYLSQDRSICDSQTYCDLFDEYMKALSGHLKNIERSLYPTVLTTAEQDAVNQVNNFMEGSQAIKRIVKQYKKNWIGRNKALKIKDHAVFIEETDGLFDAVLQRLQDETEKLYPLVKG